MVEDPGRSLLTLDGYPTAPPHYTEELKKLAVPKLDIPSFCEILVINLDFS
jgi:hypothetical protein